jgi:hypothetical protein
MKTGIRLHKIPLLLGLIRAIWNHMGDDASPQSESQPGARTRPPSQRRRGRSFGPGRRGHGRGRRPAGTPPGAQAESPAPASTESPLNPIGQPPVMREPEAPEPAREAPEYLPASEERDIEATSDGVSAVEAESELEADQPSERQRPEPARPPSSPGRQSAPERRPYTPAPPKEFRPASPKAIHEAIEDVNRVVETLKAALEDMEELLETLELAERQQEADEQEIETLRRSLRSMHRPPERGPRH